MRRTTTWRIAAAISGLAMLATACGGDDAGSGDTTGGPTDVPSFEAGSTMAEIQASGKLRVGTKFDQPLFGQQTPSGDLQGFDIEIAKIIAVELFGPGGADKIDFQESVSANREPFLQDDVVDIVVATYTINDKRKELIEFAGPYYLAGQDIMVLSDDDSVKGVDDLDGKKVCSVDGSTSIKNLADMAPGAEIIAFDAYSKCAEALGDGSVDAVTTDNVILLGLAEQSGGKYKLVENPFTEEPYGIGVKQGRSDLRAFINDVIDKMYEDGRWDAAWKATVGAVASEVPAHPAVDRY